jgi:imidazolonepropionase-like amidohydrolase
LITSHPKSHTMGTKVCLVLLLVTVFIFYANGQSPQRVLLKNVTVIDGSGKAALEGMNVLVEGGKIKSVAKEIAPSNVKIIDLDGKTIMPMMTNVHGHLGMSKGTTVGGVNFTRDHILKELERYQSYGVGTVVSMGMDEELIFSIRDESRSGSVGGATVYTAGYGFRPPLASGSKETGLEKIYRPATPAEAVENMRELAALKPDVVKIWVDDTGVKPEIYRAIISEAHKHHIKVAAHLFYLKDAHLLIDAGVDFFAHSIRDKEVDDGLIAKMKAKGIVYIPTLTRDVYEFIFGTTPLWVNDAFFKAALEPGVFEMITSPEYQNKITGSPGYQRNRQAYQVALKNLKKVFDAGVLVALGTDSGAFPVRAQGFSEHLELQLMVDAGLSPLEAITVATRNACKAMDISNQGSLSPGMRANFIVLNSNPTEDIKATQSIHSIWKNGVQVSSGPFAR